MWNYNKKECKSCGELSQIKMRGLCSFCYGKRIKSKTKSKKIDFLEDDLSSLSNSKLKKIADWFLRQYLLKESEFDGLYKCFITSKLYPESEIQVAHYIGRQNMNLRYSLLNCHLVNSYSNSYEDKIFNESLYGKGISKHHYDYSKALVSEYGDTIIESLNINKSNKDTIFDKYWYLNIIDSFKSKI